MTKHAYLPTAIIPGKGSTLVSEVIKEVANVTGITLEHATTKHAQTIGKLEKTQASSKKALKIETDERRSMCRNYVIIAVTNYNTFYHTSIGCEPNRVFQGHNPYNILELKINIRPQKPSTPSSFIAQDVLEQTEKILQVVRRNTMQTYIKYKDYYDKRANASKPKPRNCLYVLQLKTDHQGIKFLFTDFPWIGPCIAEKALSINNYLVRKNGTHKPQIVRRMHLPPFTPKEPIPDVQTTSQDWKPDSEVVIKPDDLYARAWEFDFEEPIFDDDQDKPSPPLPSKVVVGSDHNYAETCSTPESDAEMSLEQNSLFPTNHRSSKYNQRHNPKPN